MTVNEYTARYQYLKEPARRATEAYEKAARYFDQMKEIVLVDMGMPNTAEVIHNTAHWFPEQFDVLGDILHQRHVIQEYGATPAFDRDVAELNDIFKVCVECLEEIDAKLVDLIEASEEDRAKSLARQFETLEMNVSEEMTKYIEAWKMLENARNAVSYDNWMRRYLDDDIDDEDEEDDD